MALVPLHQGVYRDASSAVTPLQTILGAVLACGPGAVASRRSAGRVWELDGPGPDQPQVAVPRGRQPRPSGISVYRTTDLARLDVTRREGIPVTAPMLTLVDLAAELDPVTLEIAFEALWRRGSLHPDRLLEYLDQPRHRRRPGTGTLRAIVGGRASKPSDSPLEAWYFSILRTFRVPPPDRKVWVATPDGRFELDYAYPDDKVAVELDGFADHGTNRLRFTNDRTRQMLVERYRWRFLRFTKDHLAEQELWVAMMTADAIGLVPSGWRKG